MRLLDTETGQFVYFNKPLEISYAILSHTWDPNGEQTYQDTHEIQDFWASKTRPTPPAPLHPISPDPLQPVGISDETTLPNGGSLSVFEDKSAFSRLCARFRRAPALATRASRVSQWARMKTSRGRRDDDFAHSEEHPRQATPPVQPPPSVRPVSVDKPLVAELPQAAPFWDDPRLSAKVRNACLIARAYSHRYIWIDSCCIDSTSSAELSEAINSMYAWYRDASVCYAFLADVPHDGDPSAVDSLFRKSRWWKRGWTLQELIAPRVVVFLSAEWRFLGTKSSLADVISDVSGIDYMILHHLKQARDVSVAERMSWASERETTRPEDEAYSLLGIFDINMPTLYGEGRRAFLRLQEEILKRIPDQSLLVWGVHTRFVTFPQSEATEDYGFMLTLAEKSPGFFAETPSQFHKSHNITPIPLPAFMRELELGDGPLPTYAATPFGMPIPFPVIPASRCLPPNVRGRKETFFLAVLACEWEGNLLAIACTLEQSHSNYKYMERVGLHVQRPRDRANDVWIPHRYVALSRTLVKGCKEYMRVELLYGVPTEGSPNRRMLPGILPVVYLAPWTVDVLQGLGWSRPVVSQHPQKEENLVTHLTLSKGATHLCINFQGVSGRRTFPDGNQLDALSVVEIGVFNVRPENVDDYREPSCRPSGRLSHKSLTLYLPQNPEVFTFKDLPGDVLSMRFTVTVFADLGFCYLEIEILHHGKSLYRDILGTPGLQTPRAPPVQGGSGGQRPPLKQWDFPDEDDERTRSAWRIAASR
ncbi:hypothetical protein HYDPIDRAFT_42901 [Hydnomerulius pinastri MD-312]|uniref:Heterokaryon incompatibility domain-containing protein n=1 Tax=Hydnomerulius pinastri MD-312 TaxID=994086 RepID=A0A0C9VT96_9AGAM|nr:hypothetical protein HYDPIDRAFT_42901 [Hydnomerulius pinastri MD-312]